MEDWEEKQLEGFTWALMGIAPISNSQNKIKPSIILEEKKEKRAPNFGDFFSKKNQEFWYL